MRKSDVIQYFGSTARTAKALRIAGPAVTQWKYIIPEKQAFRIERLTNGKLKYNPDLYQKNTLSAKRG